MERKAGKHIYLTIYQILTLNVHHEQEQNICNHHIFHHKHIFIWTGRDTQDGGGGDIDMLYETTAGL